MDPDNRLVAGTLEAEWNGKLRLVREAEQEYERLRLVRQGVTAQTREQILRLAEDFPQMWQDPKTPDRERKRMARLLIEDVTLIRHPDQVVAHIRFKGGANQTIHTPVRQRNTDPRTAVLAQRLQEDHHDHAAVAEALNHTGIKTARGRNFTAKTVRYLLQAHPAPSLGSIAQTATLAVARGAV